MAPKRGGPRAILARGTREERRRERAGIVLTLRSPGVEKRYDNALRKFFWYTNATGVTMPTSPFVLDEIVVAYISFLWKDGEPIGLAGDTISGLQARLPMLKGN